MQAVGRRKESVARVRLSIGKGQITINGKPIDKYFAGEAAIKTYQRPFYVAQLVNKFDTSVKIVGGGLSSQLGAVVHGISRALSQIDVNKRTALKKEGLLTRDPRVKERRKYGHAQKARAKKQSPKR